MTAVGVPDPAELRDLSDVVHNFLGPACDATDLDAPCWSLAQRILTSDWLADRDRTRDRELGERIAAWLRSDDAEAVAAAGIEEYAYPGLSASECEQAARHALDALIARAESERARQHTGTGGE